MKKIKGALLVKLIEKEQRIAVVLFMFIEELGTC